MHLGKKNNKHNYIISEEEQTGLEKTTVAKDLGISVDNELGFKEHINKVINKANSPLGIIIRSYTCLERQNLALLYKTLVSPLPEYGNLVWSPYLKRDIEQFEPELYLHYHIKRHHIKLKILKLPSLKYRRARGDIIETYKYLHGINKVLTHFLPLA